MDDASFLVKVANALGDLKNDVTSKVFAEVRQFDDLMEQLATLHH